MEINLLVTAKKVLLKVLLLLRVYYWLPLQQQMWKNSFQMQHFSQLN